MNKNDLAALKSALETMVTRADEIATAGRNALAVLEGEPDVTPQGGGAGSGKGGLGGGG